MTTIENNILRVTIDPKGAELTSIFNKETGLEYMWNADPAFWPKHSPILFPVIGALKQESYIFNKKEYRLPRHGFARDMMFSVKEHGPDSAVFQLKDSETSKKNYPFEFVLNIHYSLLANTLSVAYLVVNPAKEDLYFSIGAHPAFALPLVEGTEYPDYYLQFAKKETVGRWPISAEGLIEDRTEPVLDNSEKLSLSRELFAKDALVFKSLKSTQVSLRSDKTAHGLDFDFPGFPFLGLWAKPGADFLCIEPWCGIADSVHSNRQLTKKEGINRLAPTEEFSRAWTVKLY
jgi:galactose mutarotase-like enzyme